MTKQDISVLGLSLSHDVNLKDPFGKNTSHVSAGFYMGHFDSSIDDKSGYFSTDKRISMKHISIGGGYAYNYVPDKHWLLHASLVPHVIVWHDYSYSVTLDADTNLPLEKKIPYGFPCT